MDEEPTNDVVIEEQEEEAEEIPAEQLVSKKSKREMTPEYKAVLVERLKKARALKRKAHDLGVTPKRKIAPDPDEPKRFYCEICRRSYKTHETLKKHNNRFHSEKVLSNIIKEKEMSNVKINAETQQTNEGEAKPEQCQEGKPEAKPNEKKETDEKPKEDTKKPEAPDGVTNEVLTPNQPTIGVSGVSPHIAPTIGVSGVSPHIAPAPTLYQRGQRGVPAKKPSGPPRYTYEEFKEIERKKNEEKKKAEKEARARAKQEHILKTIANMKNGGIMC